MPKRTKRLIAALAAVVAGAAIAATGRGAPAGHPTAPPAAAAPGSGSDPFRGTPPSPVVAAFVTGRGTAEAQIGSACAGTGRKRICVLTGAPDASGDVAVRVTARDARRIVGVRFSWNGQPLIEDFAAPYGFSWRTTLSPNSAGTLRAEALTSRADDAPAAAAVSVPLTIAHPGGTAVRAAHDYLSWFAPRTYPGDPVFAAVGDGGDGTADSTAVAASIRASRAGMLLYLGDIYETGTPVEWDVNFGRSAPQVGAHDWGLLAPYTKPVLGNHEAHDRAAFSAYWHGTPADPATQTFVWRGIRFVVLDSECAQVDCGTTSTQYRWAERVLQANTHRCVVAAWHRPVVAAKLAEPRMQPLFALVARYGGDLVLNGHEHGMQQYQPMNATLAAGQVDSHLVELIAGSGGHLPHKTVSADPRSAWQKIDQPGAVYVTAHGPAGAPTGLSWSYRDQTDKLVAAQGTGSVHC